MSAELIVGAVGALASLTAVLIKTLSHRRENDPESVTITVQRGGDRIEKTGMAQAEDVSRMLDMVKT